jgi:hypothetical protein
MPTQVGSTVTDFDNATPTSLTTSFTQAAGVSLVLVVKVGTEAAVAHDSVTFNAVGFTKQVDFSAFSRRVSIWTLVDPDVTTADIVVSLGAAGDVAMIADSWQDVDQTTPVSNSASNSGNNATPSVVVASISGEVVLDAVNHDDDGSNPTVGAGQTEIADVEVIADFRFFSSEQAGAAPNVTMDWTSSADMWVSCGVSLKSGAPPAVPDQSHQMVL